MAQVCDIDNSYFTVRVADNSEVYCTKILGYEQKASGTKTVVENSSKKTNFEAAKSAKIAKEAAVVFALKAMNCGKRTIATLLVQNASKGLTKRQIKQMNKAYRDIKELLETGSLDSAKEEIEAVVADGTLVTEADKTALIAELDSCKP